MTIKNKELQRDRTIVDGKYNTFIAVFIEHLQVQENRNAKE
jgi:hypothetical protein